MSHLVLTGDGTYAEISQNAALHFDHLFDLDREVREKFFTGSEQDTESQHSSESSFNPIPSTVGSGTTTKTTHAGSTKSRNSTNSGSAKDYNCRYHHGGDGRSIHGGAMRESNSQDVARERRLGRPKPPPSTAHTSIIPPSGPKSALNKQGQANQQKNPGGRKPRSPPGGVPRKGGETTKVPMHLINKIITENPTITVQQKNPKVLKSKSGQYYEVYKAATTVREYLRIHPDPNTPRKKADLQYDIGRGYVNIETSTHNQAVQDHLLLHKALSTQVFGLIVQPLCVPGHRPMQGKINGDLVEFANDRFTVTADVAELNQTAPELQQSMLDAMVAEMESLLSMNTFRWAVKPANAKCISTRMVLKTKYRADGTFDKHKARLVVRGFMQKQGKDFFETFTPTSDFMTFRVLMAEAAHQGWEMWHADVKNAFCNADIDADVFINMPKGITLTDHNKGPNRAIKLDRALYGLKQSPRLWFQTIAKYLRSQGFTQGKREPTLFQRANEFGEITYVLVYVDDLVITGPNTADIATVRQDLEKRFTLGSYEQLSSYLGLDIRRSKTGNYSLHSAARVEQIAEEFPLPVLTLSPQNQVPRKPSGTVWANATVDSLCDNEIYALHNYRHLVGAINYMCTTAKPGIALAQSRVAEHMCNPNPVAAKHLYWLVRYLATTKDDALTYTPRDSTAPALEVYSDSNFGDMEAVRLLATSGTLVTYRGRPIAWKSKKQPKSTRSTHSAELIALDQSARMALSARFLLEEMNLGSTAPTPIYVDNEALAFTVVAEHMTDANRHMKSKYFAVCDDVADGNLSVLWMRGTHNPADAFTKALHGDIFNRHNDFMLYGTVPAEAPRPSGRGGELTGKYIDLPADYLKTGVAMKGG